MKSTIMSYKTINNEKKTIRRVCVLNNISSLLGINLRMFTTENVVLSILPYVSLLKWAIFRRLTTAWSADKLLLTTKKSLRAIKC